MDRLWDPNMRAPAGPNRKLVDLFYQTAVRAHQVGNNHKAQLYRRAALLALKGHRAEAKDLVRQFNRGVLRQAARYTRRILRRRRANVAPARPRRARRPFIHGTLNNHILGYVETIKHKKELLLQFLKRMYERGYRYDTQTLKWKRRRRPVGRPRRGQ